jgi:hypothetical protein
MMIIIIKNFDTKMNHKIVYIFINFNCLLITLIELKKVDFLFDHSDPQTSYYCPSRHQKSSVDNLCFYINPMRQINLEASKFCKLNSQRLVEINDEITWKALFTSLNNYYKAINHNNIINKSVKFFIGQVMKRRDNFRLIWLESKIELNTDFMCQLHYDQNQRVVNETNESIFCIELIDHTNGYVSRNGYNSCLKLTDCNKSHHSICEWRGDSIENFNIHLEIELIKSYVVTVSTFIIFIILLIIIFIFHQIRIKNEMTIALNEYSNERKIFEFDKIYYNEISHLFQDNLNS